MQHYMTISAGNSRKSINWKQEKIVLSAFFDRLKEPPRSPETLAEYKGLPKAEQDRLKESRGGYVGGTLNGTRRLAKAVTGRCMITLDLDNIPKGKTDDVLKTVDGLGCCYCVYSTRKHSPEAPRLRLVFPSDRIMTPDEYEPCARYFASRINIEWADPTTYDINRLMYYPTLSADSEFVYQANTEKPLFSVDSVLNTYADWHDVKQWAFSSSEDKCRKREAKKAGDPEAKDNLIGLFCSTYDIYRAMSELIPGVYEPVDDAVGVRYTYVNGSTAGGAIVYENGKFLFSHHATDPCSGKLVNAFDLVRLHKFSDLDDEADPDSPITDLPSYKAMTDYALSLDAVKATRNKKAHESAQEDFKDLIDPSQWMMKLKLTPGGKYEQTAHNIGIVLEYDPRLKGRISRNTFENRVYGRSPLPWGKHETEAEGQTFTWSDTDEAGLRNYLERLGFDKCKSKIDDAFMEHIARHSFNPIHEYLDGLQWDGQPRLDTLLIDYLGAEDTPYVKAVTRKAFVACVSRIFKPACKFDYMLVLIGSQGIGKSTLLAKMGRDFSTHEPGRYTNDSFRTFEGKEASEALNGSWLIEVAELDAMRKSESTKVKQFVSQLYDEYRPAYGRNKECFPRQCVFFGTGNSKNFLDDPTGNRRFWAVDLHGGGRKSIFTDLDGEIDQLWAEAVTRYKVTGENLFLPPELEKVARIEQEKHRNEHPWTPLILDWLSKPVPADWSEWPIDHRRDYWACNAKGDYSLVPRNGVCVNEIWCECLMKPLSQIKPDDSRVIGNILRTNHFKSIGSRKHPPYGSCKLWQIDISENGQNSETDNE